MDPIKKPIKIGDRIRVTGGEYEGRTGNVTYTGTNGNVEVHLDEPLKNGCHFIDVWDFNLKPESEESFREPKGENKVAEIKDSGERTEFSSGAVRDLHDGKGNMYAMPWAALLRLSLHYENGAKKYGLKNYTRGIPVSSFLDSAFRHLSKYAAGWDDEDHLAAAAFNILGILQMEEEHPEMCDVPERKGKKDYTYPKSENKTEKTDSENV